MQDAITRYIQEITQQFTSGHAREHAYRPALERLMSSFENVRAVNDPARSANGNPDFVFLKASDKDIILGYAEAKDITVDLDKTLKTEQLRRYAGYEKLFLTNYIDFIFLQNGEEYERISIGKLVGNTLNPDDTQYPRLSHELRAFLERAPESIKSGKRLSIIMGGKARRIRDNVREYLKTENERNSDLEHIYELMKEMLVHDLSKDKFADMYAQTLVYGLFAARYNDTSPVDFSRREAVENVPKSNPFLRKFFDHIAGADFDVRLRHIVDELCEVFQVSDVQMLVHKHLRLFEVDDEKDPIIHFYEDFLKEYDPDERKKMGAYYTPVPVVRYIVRKVDEILKTEFGLSKGLADNSIITKEIDHGQELQIRDAKTGKLKKTTKELRQFHKVQVLDPAVGTATFLNETIKYIRQGFDGQEGQWPGYVNEHLLPRLHGFELMVAPYTVAHLKLGITLQEIGVDTLQQRLGVYLTNTLEEGIPRQQDLFSSFGLAQAVTEESQKASEIKHERPVMVVMGNPPYSVSSNNKSAYIENLIADYKKDLNERNIQPLSDDYIKFIRFAEDMISKTGEGIVAMITNNSYIDGIVHRQMRKHLRETFDKIYILDLHGNSKKKETAPNGSKDENVFDIMQGVSIMVALKTGKKQSETLGEVYHAEQFGIRQRKFQDLANNNVDFSRIEPSAPNYIFTKRDLSNQAEYETFVSVLELFVKNDKVSGVETGKDSLFTDFDSKTLEQKVQRVYDNLGDHTTLGEFKIKDNSNFPLRSALERTTFDGSYTAKIQYKIFDSRSAYYNPALLRRPSYSTMRHMLSGDNLGLVLMRAQVDTPVFTTVMLADSIIDKNFYGFQSYIFPLYLYHDDGTRTVNFDQERLKVLLEGLGPHCYVDHEDDITYPQPDFVVTAQDTLDYIYAVLHSPNYRAKYKEFLKSDFPRIPKPENVAEFNRLTGLGRELRQLHLMKSSTLDNYETTYSSSGTNEVEKISYQPTQDYGNVYINDTQFFGNVPKIAWEFYIGGYQPAQKWLKERKGRTLSHHDIDHYQKIIKALTETHRIMQEIDG